MKNYDVIDRIRPNVSFKLFFKSLIQNNLPKDPYHLLKTSIFKRDYEYYYFNYGRSAIRFLFNSMKFKKVIFPAFICPTLVRAAISANVRPIFIDVNLDDFNLDQASLEVIDYEDVDAIFAVHTFGVPFDVEKIKSLTRKYGVYLIEDSALALFAKYNEKYCGNFGDFVLFSMYKQTPNLAGAILLSDADLEKPRLMTERLQLRDLIRLIQLTHGPHQYPINLLRRKKPLPTPSDDLYEEKAPNDLSHHLFNQSLEVLGEQVRLKNVVVDYYLDRVKDSEYIIFQKFDKNSVPSWYNFSVRLTPDIANIRDSLLLKLRKKGIFCDRVWYDSPVMLKEFKEYIDPGKYPNATLLSKSIVNLPIKPDYSKEDVDFLFDEIKKSIESLI